MLIFFMDPAKEMNFGLCDKQLIICSLTEFKCLYPNLSDAFSLSIDGAFYVWNDS